MCVTKRGICMKNFCCMLKCDGCLQEKCLCGYLMCETSELLLYVEHNFTGNNN